MNACNWALGLYGAMTKPGDVATFILAIFILNLMIYTVFYIVMKVRLLLAAKHLCSSIL